MNFEANQPKLSDRATTLDHPDPKQNSEVTSLQVAPKSKQINLTIYPSFDNFEKEKELSSKAEDFPVFNPKRPNMFLWLSEGSLYQNRPCGGKFIFNSNTEDGFEEEKANTPLITDTVCTSDYGPRSLSKLKVFLEKLFTSKQINVEDLSLDEGELLLLQALLLRKYSHFTSEM
jgi:hypothetical protein